MAALSSVNQAVPAGSVGEGGVSLPPMFRHEAIMADPKAERSWGVYHVLHSNGFIKLATEAGRYYWIQQAFYGNKNPDWKIHFSVQPESIPMAWNTIADLFIELGCRFGMKAVYAKFPKHMKGRELTVYIFRYHPDYAGNEYFRQESEQPTHFWREFVRLAEERLRRNGVRSNGTADGDRPLGTYASLRNEAFVPFDRRWRIPPGGLTGLDQSLRLEGQMVYPPNDAGYNPAGHEDPLPSEKANKCGCTIA